MLAWRLVAWHVRELLVLLRFAEVVEVGAAVAFIGGGLPGVMAAA